MIALVVSDEGIGIAPEELDGILQPFRGGFERGTGLGLSIVHRIVSDHGGELAMTSAQGKGTTVTVKLPAASIPVATPAVSLTPVASDFSRTGQN